MSYTFVAIDLGASGTRCTTNNGQIMTLPNNIYVLDENDKFDYPVYGDNIIENLQVTINKTSGNNCTITKKNGEVENIFPVNLLMGNAAEFNKKNNEVPSVSSAKRFQRVNYYSALISTALLKLRDNLKDPIVMYLAIPPKELAVSKDIFKENLVGKYSVKFNNFNGGLTVEFEISDVKCEPEACLAVMSYFFDKNLNICPERSKYMTLRILSLDSGASTTDMAVVDGTRYMTKSGNTIPIAGNIVRDRVLGILRDDDSRIYVSDQMLDEAISTGYLAQGSSKIDIHHVVDQAKREIAEENVHDIQNYFNRVGIPMGSISMILLSGGGSIPSQYTDEDGETHVTSEAVSMYIAKRLVEDCPGIEICKYTETPRFANIKGLYIKAKSECGDLNSSANSQN